MDLPCISMTVDVRQMLAPTCHQIGEMTKGFPEDHITMLWNTLLKLLLKVPAAMLIFAQCWNFTLQVFDTGTGKPIDWRKTLT